MRVGLVIEQFDPHQGGAEQWTWQFARQLVAAGHDVHVLAARFDPEHVVEGVTTHRLPPVRSRMDFAIAAEAAARQISLDVVHDMGSGWHCDVFQPHGGSRLAAHERNMELLPRWARPFKQITAPYLSRYREFEQLLARQYVNDGRLFVALSNMVADDLRRRHGVSREQLRIVYNGVDVNRFQPGNAQTYRGEVRRVWEVEEHELLLLIVAHNFTLKGVPTLIRAAARLQRDGLPVRLIVAGGINLTRWRHFARRAGAKVTFAGAVEDAAPLYAAADLYVQPTFYDPCSLVVLEALASGLPVITSRFNGAGELLSPGVQGYVLSNPADDAALASAIDSLRDAGVRHRMSRAARALALQHSLEQNSLAIIDLYEEVCARRARRAA